jgi:hypothetical protein
VKSAAIKEVTKALNELYGQNKALVKELSEIAKGAQHVEKLDNKAE